MAGAGIALTLVTQVGGIAVTAWMVSSSSSEGECWRGRPVDPRLDGWYPAGPPQKGTAPRSDSGGLDVVRLEGGLDLRLGLRASGLRQPADGHRHQQRHRRLHSEHEQERVAHPQ